MCSSDLYGTSLYSYEDLGGTGTGSSYYANQSSSRNIYNDLVFNFNYDLTSKLNLKFNIGGNVQDRAFSVITNGGTNLDVAGFYHISNVLNLDNISRLDNRKVNYRKVGAFANVDLAYSDYLFLNATDRIEQSSTVEKSYMYPSVGLSFIPTKAFEMLKDSKLSYAKLNASYTSVGNTSAVGPYNTNTVAVIPQGFPFGNLAAFGFNFNPTNPKIKPEFVNTLEVGGQLGFFNDRINLEGSYFVAKTKDLISNATASSTSGANTLLNNIGNLENKGFEIDLGLVPVKTQNFRWDLRTSYSAAKTKITSLGDVTSINLQSNTSIGIFAEVGEDFPLIKGTSFTRDPDGNIIVDANGVPLRESQFKRLGKATPDYIVGLTNSFEYKGLKLTAVADFRTGGSVYSEAKNLLLFTGADYDATGFDRTQGYVVPGSVTSTGAVNTTTVANNPTYAGVLNYFTTTYRAVGEANVVDATALKIRELSLSYALPKKMIEKAGLQSFRFGINARNPFVFLADGKLIKPKNGLANNSYGDPESSNTAAGVGPQNNPFRAGFGNAQGIMNIGQYPTTKTYGFSINVTF